MPVINVQRVDYIRVPVTDMEKANHFYGEVLGLERNPNSPAEDWVEYETGNVTLAVMTPHTHDYEFTPLPPGTLALRVPDVAEAKAKLEAAGVEVNEMWDSGVCHGAGIRDPAGNPILLHHRYKPYGPNLKGETMTTLENRPKTALLVVDVQNGVVEGAPERDTVVANVGSLVEKARQEEVPVVWVQHSDEGLAKGSDEWRIVPELSPDEAEPLIEKNYGDSFEDTTLESVLSGLGVGRLVVVGAQTDACIRSTLHGAFVRGYDATLVSDAHTTEDQTAWGAPAPELVIAHTNLYWNDHAAPGRTAGTVETKEVDFGG